MLGSLLNISSSQCECSNIFDKNCTGAMAILEDSRDKLTPHAKVQSLLMLIYGCLSYCANAFFVIIMLVMLYRKLLPAKRYLLLVVLSVSHGVISVVLILSSWQLWQETQKGFFGVYYSQQSMNNYLLVAFLETAFFDPTIIYCTLCLLQLYAVRRPIEYKFMKKWKYIALVCTCWSTTPLIWIINALLLKRGGLNECTPQVGVICNKNTAEIAAMEQAQIINMFIMFALLACIIGSYGSVQLVIYRRNKRIEKQTNSERNRQTGSNEERSIRKTKLFLHTLRLNLNIFTISVFVEGIFRTFVTIEMLKLTNHMKLFSVEEVHWTGTFSSTATTNIFWRNSTKRMINELTCDQHVHHEQIIAEIMATMQYGMYAVFFSLARMITEPLVHSLSQQDIRNFINGKRRHRNSVKSYSDRSGNHHDQDLASQRTNNAKKSSIKDTDRVSERLLDTKEPPEQKQ